MEARAHDAVEFAQALDDHGVLLLDYEEQVAGERAHDNEDERDAEQSSQQVEDEHGGSFSVGSPGAASELERGYPFPFRRTVCSR